MILNSIIIRIDKEYNYDFSTMKKQPYNLAKKLASYLLVRSYGHYKSIQTVYTHALN